MSHGRKDRKAQPDSLFDTDEFLEFSIPTQEYSLNQRMALEKQAEIDNARNMECRALLRWMSRRKELTESIDMLHAILHHGDDSNE